MKKQITLALTGAVAVGLAVPAMAETTFSGWIGVNPMIIKETVGGDQIKPVDQRFRFTMTNKINDFATVVWQTEIDTPWGHTASSTGKVYGGNLNTDGINLETKHLYLKTAIPSTDFGLSLGLQNVGDKTGGLFLYNDVAAGLVTYSKDALGVAFGLAKPGEYKYLGADVGETEDELWAVLASYKVSDTLSVNADVFYYDFDDGSDSDFTYVGVGAKTMVSDIGIDGALALQSGDSVSGFALNVGAKAKIADIATGARAVYIADNDSDDELAWVSLTETPLAGEGLYFFTFSGNANYGTGKKAITDAAIKNYGLLGLMVNGTATVATDYTVKGALGYFQAVTDETSFGDKDGKDLGIEVAATVSRKLAEKIDVSLYASYVFAGSFYGDDLDSEDNPYAVGLKVVAPF